MIDARISSVEERFLGSALAADASAGAGTITVSDGTDFDEIGQLNLGAEVLVYSDVNEDTGVITLVGTLASNHFADDPVYVYPLSQERIAYLVSGDDPKDEEGMAARVPYALYDKIPVGIRSWPDGEGETVQSGFMGDELVIQELTGQAPVIDGSFVDASKIDFTGVPIPTSDGSPPSSSPAFTSTTGTLRYVFLRWDPIINNDQVTYEVHISTTDGFIPSILTKVLEVSGTFAAVNTLANGTILSFGTNYYFRLIAKDADGAAAAGTQSGAIQLDPAAPADLSVGAVTAAKLESFLVLATTIATASSGARIEMNSFGITLFDSLGDVTMFMDAQTGTIVIRGQFEFGADPNNPSRLTNQDLIDLVKQPSTFQTAGFVRATSQEYSNTGSTTINQGFSKSTAGNLLLMDIQLRRHTGTPQTITGPSGWTQIATQTVGLLRTYTFKRENAPALSSASFTTSITLGVNDVMKVTVSEFSGVQVGDVNTSATGTGTSISSGVTGTQAQAQGLVWGTVTRDSSATVSSIGINLSGTPATGAIAYNRSVAVANGGADFLSVCDVFAVDSGTLDTVEVVATGAVSTDWIATVINFKSKASTGTPDTPDTGRARVYTNIDMRGDTQVWAISDRGETQQLSGVPYGLAYDWYTDFIGSALPAELLGFSNNGGTNVFTTGIASHPGIYRLTTGSTSNSTGNAGIRFGEVATAPLQLGNGSVHFGTLIKPASSTLVRIRAGLSDTVPQNDPTANGFIFRWSSGVNSGKFQKCIGTTFTDTGVTLVAGTWYLLEIIVSADATSAEFFINGTSVGTSSGAAQTGAPLVTGVAIDKDSSTPTSRTVDVDFLFLRGVLTANRF